MGQDLTWIKPGLPSPEHVTMHFTRAELACRCGCGLLPEKVLCEKLEELRSMWGKPLQITSGARCLTYNTKVNGSKNSQHILGLAVDINCVLPTDRYKLVQMAITLGWRGIGIDATFLHLDLRASNDRLLFLYS